MVKYNLRLKEKMRMYAGMAQSVERRIGSAEVTGPIPVSSSFLYPFFKKCILRGALFRYFVP